MSASNKSVVGVDQIYYALVTTDDASTYAAGTPATLAPAMTIAAAPKTNSKTQYADNKPYDAFASEGETEFDLEITGMTPAVYAIILGKVYDAVNGRVFDNGATPPYCALGFRALKSDGKYRYYWFLKGRFQVPSMDVASKTDTPDPKSTKLKFTAISSVKTWALDGSTTDSVKAVWGDTGDTALSVATWFDAVQTPVAGAIPALTCTPSPVDGATGVAADANVTLTFSNALAADAEDRVVLTKNDGAIVASAISINAARTVITINPTGSLTAGGDYIVTVAGVVDTYGQAFTNTVYNFTVAP